eukprot:jgi/Astpho2/2278/Aster-03249
MQAKQAVSLSKVQHPNQHIGQDPDAGLPAVTELKWERPLRVVQYPDPRLRAQNACIATFGESLQQLAAEMFTVMYQDDGAGLAAPQVGVNVRLMVYNGEWRGKGAPRPEDQVILVNPRIVSTSKDTDVVQEGCLSFHDKTRDMWIRGKVERPLEIEVEAQDGAGQKVSLSLSGWKARIFQHEHDHLAGVLFPDRVLEDSFDSIKPELINMEKEFAEANPDVEVQSISKFRYPAQN